MPSDDGNDDIKPAMVVPENKIRDEVTMDGRISGDGFDPELLARAEAWADQPKLPRLMRWTALTDGIPKRQFSVAVVGQLESAFG